MLLFIFSLSLTNEQGLVSFIFFLCHGERAMQTSLAGLHIFSRAWN
jgi:hypothetical protein